MEKIIIMEIWTKSVKENRVQKCHASIWKMIKMPSILELHSTYRFTMIARSMQVSNNKLKTTSKKADTNDDKNDYNNATGDALRALQHAIFGVCFFFFLVSPVPCASVAGVCSSCIVCASVGILLCWKSRCQSVSGNNALLCWHIFFILSRIQCHKQFRFADWIHVRAIYI